MALHAPQRPAILFRYQQLLTRPKRRAAALEASGQVGPKLPSGPRTTERPETAARRQRFGPYARSPVAGARSKFGKLRANFKRLTNSDSKLAERIRHESGAVHH